MKKEIAFTVQLHAQSKKLALDIVEKIHDNDLKLDDCIVMIGVALMMVFEGFSKIRNNPIHERIENLEQLLTAVKEIGCQYLKETEEAENIH